MTGDKKSNAIEVSLDGTNGYVIRGTSGTKINGQSSVVV